MFETIILPALIGLAVNGISKNLFDDFKLNDIIEELYNKARDEFNRKYEHQFGGELDNFITREENHNLLLNNILSYNDIKNENKINKLSFENEITPDFAIKDFLYIFNELIESDDRLTEYRAKKKHFTVSKEILNEIGKIRNTRLKKFEDIDIYIKKINILEFTLEKTKSEIEQVKKLLKYKDIVHITSYREFGKSTTLLKICLDNELRNSFDKVLVMNHGVKDILNAFENELYQDSKYLILIDDVDLCITEFEEIVKYTKLHGIKMIITSQTYSYESIKSIIVKHKLYSSYKSLSINNWGKGDYLELLTKLSGDFFDKDKEYIAIKYDSPSAITLICDNIQENMNIQDILSNIKETMQVDVDELLKDKLSHEKIEKLMYCFCCNVPFYNDKNFRDLLSSQLLINETEIDNIINILIDFGMLRKIGNECRFYPDLKGDIYLSYSMKDNIYENEFSFCINTNQQKVLKNIRCASQINDVDMKEKLTPIVKTWISEKYYFNQVENLKKAKYIVEFIPEQILNMIFCYLEDTIKSEDADYFKLSSDDFGPVLAELWEYSKNSNEILEAIRKIELFDLIGFYSNYKPKELIEEVFSPINYNTDFIITLFNTLENWAIENIEKSMILITYAICEILKSYHEKTISRINGIEFKNYTVKRTDELVILRKKCIDFMIYIIGNKFTCDNVKLLKEMANSIGTFYGCSSDIPKSLPLYEEILEERKILIKHIGEKLLKSNDMSCNVILEEILFKMWALNLQGSDETVEYLNKYKPSINYIFLKYSIECDNVYINFIDIQNKVNIDDKWVWYLDNVMFNDDLLTDDYSKIVQELNKEIKNIDDLFAFFNQLEKCILNFSINSRLFLILEQWYITNHNLFKEYYESEYFIKTWSTVKFNILRSMALIDNNLDISFIKDKISDLNKLEDEEILSILSLFRIETFNDSDIVLIINDIIDNSKLGNYSWLIREIYFIFNSRDKQQIVPLLIKIINKFDFNYRIDDLEFIIKSFLNELKKHKEYNVFRKCLIEKLISIYEIGYHENSLLEILIENFDEAISFIENRLSLDNFNGKVPYHGYDFVKKFLEVIENYEMYIKLVINSTTNKKIHSIDKQKIYGSIFFIKDASNRLIILQLLDNSIKDNRLDIVIEILENYRLNDYTINDFISGLKYLNDNGREEEAEKLLYEYTYPTGVWSRNFGENSQIKISILKAYHEIERLLPFGKLKSIAVECINNIEKDMQEELIKDESILNPR